MKKYIQTIKIGILALLLGIGVYNANAAWTAAPASPPSSNVDAPLNIGNSFQTKLGSISVGGWNFLQNTSGPVSTGSSDTRAAIVWGATDNPYSWYMGSPSSGYTRANDPMQLFIFDTDATGRVAQSWLRNGNVGIGTITPAATLDVNGTIGIRSSGFAAGKILTSDATGLASWQDAPNTPAGTDYTGILCKGDQVQITTPWKKIYLSGNIDSGPGGDAGAVGGFLTKSRLGVISGVIFIGQVYTVYVPNASSTRDSWQDVKVLSNGTIKVGGSGGCAETNRAPGINLTYLVTF